MATTSTYTSTSTSTKKPSKDDPSNPRLKIGSRDKTVGWYTPTLTTLPAPTQDLFVNYSGIGTQYILAHILQIRDRAWEVHPYPFLGLLHFTTLTLSTTPSYNHILSCLNSGNKLLDIGCGLGQDIRKLIHDGAPGANMYGVETRPEFLDLSYELFNDKATFAGKLIVADIFDQAPKSKMKKYEGKFDFIFIGLFLHLFDWKGQVRACERIVKLLRNERNVMVVGHQVGSVDAGEVKTGGGRMMFKHDVASFERLWREVGKKTGTVWSVWAWLEEDGKAWEDVGTRRLVFEVVRTG